MHDLCVSSFAAQHDGYGNGCDSAQQHVMSTAPQRLTNDTFNNPFVFSTCSIQYFRNYLASLTEYVNTLKGYSKGKANVTVKVKIK